MRRILPLLLLVAAGGCGDGASNGAADLAPGGGTNGSSTGSTTGSSTGGSTGSLTNGTTSSSTGGSTGSLTGGTTGSSTGSSTGGTTTGNADLGSGTTGAGCGSGGASPTAGPADLFPCDNPWYKDVSALSPATGSSTMIGAIKAWETGGDKLFHIDFSMVLLHANSSTPTHSFTLDPGYDPDNDHDAVPVPAGGAVEGNPGYACASGGDCHLLVIDGAAHKLFELWTTDISGGNYTATQESVWDLQKAYTPAMRGYGCTSADAGGLSIASGLIGVREVVKGGAINHALRFTMPNAYILKNSWVYPATHGTGATGGGASSTTGPAYGARLRLKNTTAVQTKIGQVTSKGGKLIVAALQKYGMILADGANFDTLIAEDDRLTRLEDPTLTWAGVLGPDDLTLFAPGDFEVVDYGTVGTGDNCVRAP
jgi:hypothetical protein